MMEAMGRNMLFSTANKYHHLAIYL